MKVMDPSIYAPVEEPKARKPKVKSDGGSSSYYELPEDATELMDLIEAKGMSFARGNLFKALYRLGEKDGVEVEYDLRKMEFFIARMRESYRKYGRV